MASPDASACARLTPNKVPKRYMHTGAAVILRYCALYNNAAIWRPAHARNDRACAWPVVEKCLAIPSPRRVRRRMLQFYGRKGEIGV